MTFLTTTKPVPLLLFALHLVYLYLRTPPPQSTSFLLRFPQTRPFPFTSPLYTLNLSDSKGKLSRIHPSHLSQLLTKEMERELL